MNSNQKKSGLVIKSNLKAGMFNPHASARNTAALVATEQTAVHSKTLHLDLIKH